MENNDQSEQRFRRRRRPIRIELVIMILGVLGPGLAFFSELARILH